MTKIYIENYYASDPALASKLGEIQVSLAELRDFAVTAQEKINALAETLGTFAPAITTAVAGIRSDIQALKVANDTLDFTPLETKVNAIADATASLNALDLENPVAW